MLYKKGHNLKTSIKSLGKALQFYDTGPDPDDIKFLAVSKAFEVALEYAWKELKKQVEDKGLEAPSPKDAIRQAVKVNLIKEASLWIDFVNARNMGVHDYFTLPPEDYLKLIRSFFKQCQTTFTSSS